MSEKGLKGEGNQIIGVSIIMIVNLCYKNNY